MKGWQRGYQLQHLQALAHPFKERHKPLMHGFFGLVNERDIAQALKQERLIWTAPLPAQAAAIARPITKLTEYHDFTGLPIVLDARSWFISVFAATDFDAGVKVIQGALERSHGRLYVEIFEEDDIAARLMEALGFHWIGSKIAAGSEVKGIYRSGERDAWPMDCRYVLQPEEDATLEVLRDNFLSPSDMHEIRQELELYGEHWQQHYSSYNKRKSWTAFALRGYDISDPGFIIKPAEMSKKWKAENPERLDAASFWTTASDRFPAAVRVAKRLGADLDRVRFMRLRAKDGELSRHADITDREAGVADGRVTRLHIPIVTSDAVTFFGWDARGKKIERKFPEGALCYLDQRKPHAVVNRDPNLDRIHLVIDAYGCNEIRKLIFDAVCPF